MLPDTQSESRIMCVTGRRDISDFFNQKRFYKHGSYSQCVWSCGCSVILVNTLLWITDYGVYHMLGDFSKLCFWQCMLSKVNKFRAYYLHHHASGSGTICCCCNKNTCYSQPRDEMHCGWGWVSKTSFK